MSEACAPAITDDLLAAVQPLHSPGCTGSFHDVGWPALHLAAAEPITKPRPGNSSLLAFKGILECPEQGHGACCGPHSIR